MSHNSPDNSGTPLPPWLLKKPSANEEETWQAKEKKHIVEPHRPAAQAIVANMRINNENHRKSPHCIDILYPPILHCLCKNTEKSRNSWVFMRKMLLLQHE